MRTFFLFYLLSYLLHSPLLALLLVGIVFYLGEARYAGRYFNPAGALGQRNTIRELRRTVQTNDHNVAAHNDLGRLLADQGKWEEAKVHMGKAINRMAESPETNFYHGLCLLRTGDAAEGKAAIAEALRINPRFGYGKPQLVLAATALEEGRIEDALDWAHKAVKLNTSSVEGWVLIAEAESKLGNGTAADDALESAKRAYADLPRYLKLANRKWYKQAKKGTAG